MADKRYGLRLTLGGAPNTPHVVAPLPGFYRPDVPTPVGGKDDPLTHAEAKKAAKDFDCLELVEIKSGDVKDAEELAAETVKAARENLPEAAAVATGAETARVNDEKVAAGVASEKE